MSEADKDDAIKSLQATESGRRLLAAEDALRAISSGKLPNVERAVCRALFNARAVSEFSELEKNETGNPDKAALLKGSQTTAYLAMNLTGSPQATLFYPRSSGLNEMQLFSTYFPKLIAMIYSTVGLDVEQVADMDQETLDRLLRQGLPKVV